MPEQNKPQQPKSPYGVVSCSVPASAGIHEGKGGSRSTPMVQCSVPIPAIGMTIETAIWARLTPKPEGDEITFAASLPRGWRADDELASDSWKAVAENAAAAWNGYAAAEAAAISRLTGQKKTGPSARPGLAPRLVKRGVPPAAAEKPAA